MLKIVIVLIVVISILAIIIIWLGFKVSKLKSNYNILKKNQDTLCEDNSYNQREIDRMQEQIRLYEKKEEDIPEIKICNKKVKKNPIYKGKRVLVGDYVDLSYRNTISILRSFGMTVDVVHKGTDIVDKIKHGYKCDIIFTNNIYQEGYDGPTTLDKLKEIEGFNTPVVIHTITDGSRRKFVDFYGFDEYVVKPLTQENTKPILDKFLSKKIEKTSKNKGLGD